MYSEIKALAVNYGLYSNVRRFEIIKNTVITDNNYLDYSFDVIITTW